MRIRCYTLFDITNTNINKRSYLTDSFESQRKRFQQINFETILQIISMRCQPENISIPKKESWIASDIFGLDFKNKKVFYWYFDFDVYHNGVFENQESKLGNLFLDSNDVPMIIKLEELEDIDNKINISLERKNIHFELLYE